MGHRGEHLSSCDGSRLHAMGWTTQHPRDPLRPGDNLEEDFFSGVTRLPSPSRPVLPTKPAPRLPSSSRRVLPTEPGGPPPGGNASPLYSQINSAKIPPPQRIDLSVLFFAPRPPRLPSPSRRVLPTEPGGPPPGGNASPLYSQINSAAKIPSPPTIARLHPQQKIPGGLISQCSD
jgi:hypothetical protein